MYLSFTYVIGYLEKFSLCLSGKDDILRSHMRDRMCCCCLQDVSISELLDKLGFGF